MSPGRACCLAIAIGLAAGGPSAARRAPPPAAPVPGHVASADDSAAVARGERLYIGHCASCHGRYRQGQALWQIIDAYAGRRAPALDESGYTWRRTDEAIFRMVKFGRFATASPEISYMPAFKGVLADREILAVVAFIKARWPTGLRIAQAMLNPGSAGMPAGANDTPWRLPSSCNSLFHRSETAAPQPR